MLEGRAQLRVDLKTQNLLANQQAFKVCICMMPMRSEKGSKEAKLPVNL